jgi:hypothetical protein
MTRGLGRGLGAPCVWAVVGVGGRLHVASCCMSLADAHNPQAGRERAPKLATCLAAAATDMPGAGHGCTSQLCAMRIKASASAIAIGHRTSQQAASSTNVCFLFLFLWRRGPSMLDGDHRRWPITGSWELGGQVLRSEVLILPYALCPMPHIMPCSLLVLVSLALAVGST